MLLGPLSVLTACGGSTVIERTKLPPSLTEPCAGPVMLPEEELGQAQVELYWGRDRRNLRACKEKHAGIVKAAEG